MNFLQRILLNAFDSTTSNKLKISEMQPEIQEEWNRKHLNMNSMLVRYGFNRIFRRMTASFRVLPNFLIIGYPKCGTTSLHFYLSQHPSMGETSKKEIHFFSVMFDKGLNWYKARFPTVFDKKQIENKRHLPFITGEGSVDYVTNPFTPKRIKEIIPNVKLIVILRNPIDRAYSSYHASVRDGGEFEDTFEDAIEHDQERFEVLKKRIIGNQLNDHTLNLMQIPHLSIGKYINDMPKWLELFANQLLIINYDDYVESKKKTLENVFKFLQIPNFEIKDATNRNVGKYKPMNPKTRQKLIEYYEPYNEKLEKLLNMKFNWNK